MPVASSFKALQLGAGSGTNWFSSWAGPDGSSTGNNFGLYLSLSAGLELWWNTYSFTLNVSYTHTLVRGTTTDEFFRNMSETLVPWPGVEPKDRVGDGYPAFNVFQNVTSVPAANAYHKQNGVFKSYRFHENFLGGERTGFTLRDGGLINDVVAVFTLRAFHYQFSSGSDILAWLVNPERAAVLSTVGDGTYGPDWFHVTNVSVTLFGIILPAAFVAIINPTASPASSSLSGFSFSVTREAYTY